MTTFLEQVRPFLNSHLGPAAYTLVDSRTYLGGQGAEVEVDCGELRIQLTHERMFDFYIEVASSLRPTTWYPLLDLLLAASNEPIERSKVLVGHSMADLEDFVRRFAAHRQEVAALLRPERLPDTTRRMQQIREQTTHPELRPFVNR